MADTGERSSFKRQPRLIATDAISRPYTLRPTNRRPSQQRPKTKSLLLPPLPTSYVIDLELPDTESRLISSPRLQVLFTGSYADLKSTTAASNSLRSTSSERSKSTHRESVPHGQTQLHPTFALPQAFESATTPILPLPSDRGIASNPATKTTLRSSSAQPKRQHHTNISQTQQHPIPELPQASGSALMPILPPPSDGGYRGSISTPATIAMLRSTSSERSKSHNHSSIPREQAQLPPIPAPPRTSGSTTMPPLSLPSDGRSTSMPVKASRYLRNPPPPLQLKTSSHRPRSKRSSRRMSRERTRVSVQSFDSGIPLSPLSPRPKMPSKKEQHRRRMLKLKRTLGEEIPLELINSSISPGPYTASMPSFNLTARLSQYQFSPPSPVAILSQGHKRQHSRGVRKKSNLLSSLTSTRQAPPLSTLDPIRVNIDVDKKVSSEVPRPEPPSLPPVILISAHAGDFLLDLSTSEEDELSALPSSSSMPLPSKARDRTSGGSHWPRTPFAHACEPTTTHHTPSLTFTGDIASQIQTAKRSERRQGWSGEWNQPDIQDVIERLRNI